MSLVSQVTALPSYASSEQTLGDAVGRGACVVCCCPTGPEPMLRSSLRFHSPWHSITQLRITAPTEDEGPQEDHSTLYIDWIGVGGGPSEFKARRQTATGFGSALSWRSVINGTVDWVPDIYDNQQKFIHTRDALQGS